MAEYELIHEIINLCPNNQMRDVFFQEVQCPTPEAYVRAHMAGRHIQDMTVEPGAQGSVVIRVVADGILEKFSFSPI